MDRVTISFFRKDQKHWFLVPTDPQGGPKSILFGPPKKLRMWGKKSDNVYVNTLNIFLYETRQKQFWERAVFVTRTSRGGLRFSKVAWQF